MKKRLLVTGAGGMVGYYTREVFREFDLILSDIAGNYDKLDVTDEGRTEQFISNIRPDMVLHLAALTDVDKCELDSLSAYKCNRDGARNVALACKGINATVIYMSSGSVFSGLLGRPARETDLPDPVNAYGKSKLAGESEVAQITRRHFIIRAGWMMGGGPERDKKFIGKIMKKILAKENNLKIINDKSGSPVYAKDLLFAIKKLINTEDNFGLYHIVNESKNECSRYDMTIAIKEILKMHDLKIEPVSSSLFNLSAPRALSEALENYRMNKMGLRIMRPWRDALFRYLVDEWGTQCLK